MSQDKSISHIQKLGFAIALGIIATLFLDLVNYAQHLLMEKPLTRYEFIGRWVLYFFEGQFYHESIKAAATKPGELLIGWVGHYAIGIAFAMILLGIWGVTWLERPRFVPALVVGIVTCAIPYFIMQPGMGNGVAGMLTPNPVAVQLKVLISHVIFAIGLTVGGYILRPFYRG